MNEAVFVPAIMSMGLIFSVVTLIRDAFRWSGGRARERRIRIEATTVLSDLLGESEPPPGDIGVLSRPSYLLSTIVLVAGALYVSIGSIANYLHDGGYVSDIAWLLAVSLALASILGFLGAVSFSVYRAWPHPPSWTFGPIRVAPLTTTPGSSGLRPSWGLTAATSVVGIATALLTLMVKTGRGVALEIDQPISTWLSEVEWLGRVDAVDLYGMTGFTAVFVLLIALSGFRCRVMALVYPAAFVLSWVVVEAIQEIVARARPDLFGPTESFPSGHMVQVVFLAGLAPTALGVLLSDRRAVVLSRAVLFPMAVLTAAYRVHTLQHWPLDVVGGTLLGAFVVLASYWVLDHRNWHHHCADCPWSDHPGVTPWRRGVFDLSPQLVRKVGIAGVALALAAPAALIVGIWAVSLPTDPEGSGLPSSIAGPAQIGFAVLLAIGGLLAMRWKAVGAFVMALSASCLGVLASVEYVPLVAVGLVVLLMVPAVLTWLAWQPHETIGSIVVLAVISATALTASAVGSLRVHEHFFGPTHPESRASALESAAEWLWLGAVDTTSATVVAGGLDAGADVELHYWRSAQPAIQIVASPDLDGVARFDLINLAPAADYSYAIGTQDEPVISGTADASFRTHAEGPQNLLVALGSCARLGSNGAVFDAIAAKQPDLYLALGDLHYANLESTNPSDHVAEYARAMSKAGQAGLFSSVPTAYVWDDHDYGPNDGDSFSPARLAVSTAYRQAVPHHGVDPDPDTPIYQSFTVGRVRFVLTDTRSARTDDTMLGSPQLEWFIDEVVSASRTHAVVVWVNPTPWISDEGPAADNWSAFPGERTAIADSLVAAQVDNLIMVSGDAHMVAFDDGTNSGYASDGSRGFPVFHSGALDRPGSVKGGPYSHGTFPGAGQFATMEILDDGGTEVELHLAGHTWDGRELFSHVLSFTANSTQ